MTVSPARYGFRTFFVSALLLSCSLRPSPAQPAPEPAFQAGAAMLDITPPPGFPTGGHGPAGDISRGVWNHIFARAFFIRAADGPAVVLISLDLFAVPLGLNAAVWEKLQKQVAGTGIVRQSLIFSATHTHHGPGNFLSAAVYNQFGSSETGFSKPLFYFLRDRLTQLVLNAARSPAGASLQLYSKQITPDPRKQFILNRSPRVFSLNSDRDQVLDDLNRDRPPWPTDPEASKKACLALRLEGEPDDGWDLPGCPRIRATDRRMTVLEIVENQTGRRAGVLIFFAVHPTVLVHSAPLYNSDFVGEALHSLEEQWSTGKTVVAFFNGAEGDITARRTRRDILEVRKRSRQFQEAVREVLAETPQRLQAGVLVHARLIDTRKAEDLSCAWPNTSPGPALASQPVFGAAGVGGAELDRTALYSLGWREGAHRVAQDNQGPKLPALDASILPDLKLTRLLAPAKNFPRYLPVTYVEIGAFSLGAIPVEMSTTSALRIRSRLSTNRRYFQILGLTNEYASYTATESEYAAQDYMGASTLWGPQQAAFMECRLAGLQLADAPGPFVVPKDVQQPGPGPRKAGPISLFLSFLGLAKPAPFGPVYVGQPRELPDDGLGEILLDSQGRPDRHLPFFEWEENVSDWQASGDRTIEIDNPDRTSFDPKAEGFLTILVAGPSPGSKSNTRRWAVYWLRPLWDDQLTGKYIWKIKPSGSYPIFSDPFAVTDPQPACPCLKPLPRAKYKLPRLRSWHPAIL